MDKREYLRSLGFEVGERGRFSAEMLEALRSFEGEETQNKVVSQKILVKSIKQREATRYMLELEDGGVIEIGNCSNCKDRVIYCECKGGPQPPQYFDSPIENWYPVEPTLEVL